MTIYVMMTIQSYNDDYDRIDQSDHRIDQNDHHSMTLTPAGQVMGSPPPPWLR